MTCYQLPHHLLDGTVSSLLRRKPKKAKQDAAQVVMRCRLTLQNSKHARQDVQSYWQSDTWCLKSDLCLLDTLKNLLQVWCELLVIEQMMSCCSMHATDG